MSVDFLKGKIYRTLEGDAKFKLIHQSINIGLGRNMWVEGRYLYWLRSARFQVWDVYRPSAPVQLIETNFGGSEFIDLRKRGRYLYVTKSTEDAVWVIDVANPVAAVQVGIVTDAVNLETAHGCFLEGNYLYVCAFAGNRLTIVDVSDPAHPWVVGSITDALLNGIHDVWVEYPYAYVTTHYGGGGAAGSNTEGSFVVLNVSNPAAPTIVSSVLSYQAIAAAKQGRYFFCTAGAVGGVGLVAYDVSNPAVPVQVGHLPGIVAYWLQVEGKYAYLADGDVRIYLVDISNPAAMRLLDTWTGSHVLETGIRNLFVHGKYLYTLEQRYLTVLQLDLGLELPNIRAGESSFPGPSVKTSFRRITSDLFMDVLAVDTNHVVAAEDLTAAPPIACVIAAQPDVPRNITITITDGDASISAFQIDVVGVNARGQVATEQFLFAGGLIQTGNVAWATITSVTVTSITGDNAGDVLDVGIGTKLGLSNNIDATSDVYKIKKNNANAVVAVAQVNVAYDTYDMAVIGLAVGDDFTIWYRSNLNIVS